MKNFEDGRNVDFGMECLLSMTIALAACGVYPKGMVKAVSQKMVIFCPSRSLWATPVGCFWIHNRPK